MSKLLYFRNRHDADHIMATLAGIAASHGYVNAGGPNPGAGSVAELLAAIASGEVATVLLADTPRDMAINYLWTRDSLHPSLTEALDAIADALDEARQRERRSHYGTAGGNTTRHGNQLPEDKSRTAPVADRGAG